MTARKLKWWLIPLACVALVLLVLFGWKSPRKFLNFDPVELAARETRMWRAYYDGRKEQLALELVRVLREQFGLSYAVSALTARDFAEAAELFRHTNGDYDQIVLPVLERGYDRIHRATRADWNAHEVAQAELAWWVARRSPHAWDNRNIGRAIAHLYELLYKIDPTRAQQAGELRAEAAQVRTIGAYTSGVDWDKVRQLLTKSYQELRGAIDARRPTG